MSIETRARMILDKDRSVVFRIQMRWCKIYIKEPSKVTLYNNPQSSELKDRKSKNVINPVKDNIAHLPKKFPHNRFHLTRYLKPKQTSVKIAKKNYYKTKYQHKNVDLKKHSNSRKCKISWTAPKKRLKNCDAISNRKMISFRRTGNWWTGWEPNLRWSRFFPRIAISRPIPTHKMPLPKQLPVLLHPHLHSNSSTIQTWTTFRNGLFRWRWNQMRAS